MGRRTEQLVSCRPSTPEPSQPNVLLSEAVCRSQIRRRIAQSARPAMAVVRCAARSLGGSLLLQRQVAVAEERHRLFLARLVHTHKNPPATRQEALLEIQRKKEVLYDRICKTEMICTDYKNRQLLKSLSAQIEPRPDDPQWRRIRASKRWGDAMKTGCSYANYFLCGICSLQLQRMIATNEEVAGTVNIEVDSA